MARVFITGVAGLIGSTVASILLDKGHIVRGIDDLSGGCMANVEELIEKGLHFQRTPVATISIYQHMLRKIDVVYHFAAHAAEIKSLYMPAHDAHNNLVSFHKLMIQIIKYKIPKIVFTSTMAVYGHKDSDKMPYLETDQPKPEDMYGITKYAVEQALPVYKKVFGIDYCIIRPHNVYGPRQNLCDPFRNVLAIWCNMMMKDKKPLVYGDGSQTRALTYIDDAAPWIAEAGFNEKCLGQIINVGSEETITIKEACGLMCEAMGWKKGFDYAPARPQEIHEAWASSEKARDIFDYKTKYSFKEGIAKFADWALDFGPKDCDYGKKFEIEKNVPKQWGEKWI